MNTGAARFAARYPVVWHVIEADGAGPWLPATGLLPAASLLRRAGLADHGANRDDFLPVAFDGAKAVLRQQVMPDQRLVPTLAGAFAGQPESWRRHLNAHVFFWTEEQRRDAFLRACRRLRSRSVAAPADAAPVVVLAFDTAALLAGYGPRAFFARFNTGSTIRGGARVRRDEATLTSVEEYRAGAVAELAIRSQVMLAM